MLPLGGMSCIPSPEQQLQLDQLSASASLSSSYLAVLKDLNEMKRSGMVSQEVFDLVDPDVQAADLYLKAMTKARMAGDDVAFQMAQRKFNEAKAGMVYWRNRLAGGGL